MKNLKKLLATISLMGIIMLGVSSVNAGIIMTGAMDTPPTCTETKDETPKVDYGIIMTGFTGIIMTGFTGIIMTGAVETSPVDCGIIMTN